MKILYIHGFASSGQSGTAASLRRFLGDAEVLSPDVPLNPREALSFLQSFCEDEAPDLVIGTSMGGMFAEQMHGFDRICVNPALNIADTIIRNIGLGRQTFHSPRKDGQTEIIITKAYAESFRDITARKFAVPESDDDGIVYGLFGIHDTLVDCYDEFAAHYSHALRFDGEHRLNDSVLLHTVIPVIRRIRNQREGVVRRSILVSLETVLKNPHADIWEGVRVLEDLDRMYDIYVLTSGNHYESERFVEAASWCDSHLGVLAWDRLIRSSHPECLMMDYLVTSVPSLGMDERKRTGAFPGTVIDFGSRDFHGWAEVSEYFSRLGGQ